MSHKKKKQKETKRVKKSISHTSISAEHEIYPNEKNNKKQTLLVRV